MFALRSVVRGRGEQWSVVSDQWPAVRPVPQALKRGHIFGGLTARLKWCPSRTIRRLASLDWTAEGGCPPMN
jgi:hypothetical protein